MCFLSGGEFLQKRLRILRRYQIAHVIAQVRPFLSERDQEDKGEPDRGDKGAAPEWPLKPWEVGAAAREFFAPAQRIEHTGVIEDGELLPKKHVDKKTAEHPDLQNEQTERKNDREERSAGCGDGQDEEAEHSD